MTQVNRHRGSVCIACAALCAIAAGIAVAETSGPSAQPTIPPGGNVAVPAEVADEVFAKYQEALDRLVRGRARAAMETLAGVTALAPDWVEPHNLLGTLHKHYNERTSAIREYEEARQLDPTDFHATHALIELGALNPDKAAADAASVGVEVFEKQIIDLTNQARVEAGLDQLTPSAEMRTVALGHSQEMRDLDYFSHYSPTEGRYDVMARYRQVFREVPFLLGENLARRYGTAYSLTPANIEDTFRGLMRSETHRRNIMEPRYTQIAVAIVVNVKGDYWMTQLFRREVP